MIIIAKSIGCHTQIPRLKPHGTCIGKRAHNQRPRTFKKQTRIAAHIIILRKIFHPGMTPMSDPVGIVAHRCIIDSLGARYAMTVGTMSSHRLGDYPRRIIVTSGSGGIHSLDLKASR